MEFFEFMNRSVSNFTAVETIVSILDAAGFKRLYESDDHWRLHGLVRWFFLQLFEIPDIYLRTEDAYLYEQIAFGIRQCADAPL